MAVASLTLGIIALVMSIASAGALGSIGIICAILGIIFGCIAKSRADEDDTSSRKMANAGIICSILGLCIGIILIFLLGVTCMGLFALLG